MPQSPGCARRRALGCTLGAFLSLASAASIATAPGCATVPDRHQLYTGLSDDSKTLYDKYEQFMTDSQKDRFLRLPDDPSRKQFIDDLHVEARISRFPQHVQDAIWRRDVVVGMDGEAVMLSWGVPDDVDRDDEGIKQTWIYRKGSQTRRVVLMNGQVSDVLTQ